MIIICTYDIFIRNNVLYKYTLGSLRRPFFRFENHYFPRRCHETRVALPFKFLKILLCQRLAKRSLSKPRVLESMVNWTGRECVDDLVVCAPQKMGITAFGRSCKSPLLLDPLRVLCDDIGAPHASILRITVT